MNRAFVWCALALMVPGAALAVSTKSFVIDGNDAFEKGKLEGTASHASGRLTRGSTTERTPLEGVPVAYASTIGPDGAIYVGTGNEGKIFRVEGGTAKPFADTEAALVTSLVWAEGTLYAGTLPKGRVYAIDKAGKVKEHAALTGAEHVWGLAHDPKQRTLYAATGPEGKLFAIDRAGKSKVVHDDMAEHLLSIDLDAQGRVYAGTSSGARVVRVEGGKASVLYDFAGQEVTTLDVGPSFVAVASNEFAEAPPPGGEGAKDGPARLKRPKPGKGKVYALGFDGRAQELYASDASHVTDVEVVDGAVQVGLAQDGKVYRVTESGERALWADVDERQVVSLALGASTPHFLTSDGVSVYRVKSAGAEGVWTSAVLDAKVPSRWGELTTRKKGSLRWATRSGDTETPDASWSAWSAESSQDAPIKSVGARFLQLKLTLVGDAELYALSAYYLPQNQAARVRNVREKSKPVDPKAPTASPIIALTWDVDNPDDDRLRYRLAFRREEQQTFIPLLREHEVLEQTDYAWDTRSVPDGFYRLRVEASDEPTNPDAFVQKTTALSAPVRVDNHAPTLSDVKVQKGVLSGRVSDGLGPIERIEVSVDAAPFRPVFPDDGLLDTASERFTLPLGALTTGTHVVAVRASDAAHNIGSAELEFATP
jgi:outer membrane protein assembly factor BamB